MAMPRAFHLAPLHSTAESAVDTLLPLMFTDIFLCVSNVLQDTGGGWGAAKINGFKNIYDTRHTSGFAEGKFRGKVCSKAPWK
jgi:hypothetical protein